MRRCSKEDMAKRLAFAGRVLEMTPAQLRAKLSMAMDGVILSMPPADPVARLNYCRTQEGYMWRKPGESNRPELAGKDEYSKQVPIERSIPMWGGIGRGGSPALSSTRRRRWQRMSGSLRWRHANFAPR